MVASARREKPHIASQPVSQIDSRSATASLYLTRAQGAPCQVKSLIKPPKETKIWKLLVVCFIFSSFPWSLKQEITLEISFLPL